MHPTVQPARVASGSGCGAGSEEQVLGSALQSSANCGSGDGRILKEEKGKYGVESEGLQLSAYHGIFGDGTHSVLVLGDLTRVNRVDPGRENIGIE